MNIWFWAWVGTAGLLAFSLAHNITSGAKLRTAVIAELQSIKAKLSSHDDKPSTGA